MTEILRGENICSFQPSTASTKNPREILILGSLEGIGQEGAVFFWLLSQYCEIDWITSVSVGFLQIFKELAFLESLPLI